VLRGGRIDLLFASPSPAAAAAAASSSATASSPSSSSVNSSRAAVGGGNFELVLLGTVALVITTFLAPTVLLWHAMATALRLLGCELPLGLLALVRGALRCIPMHLFSLWLRDRIDALRGKDGVKQGSGGRRLPAGIWMEVLPSPSSSAPESPASASVSYLQLHAAAAPVSTLAFRASTALRGALTAQPPRRVLRRLLWGSSGSEHKAKAPAAAATTG